MRSVINTGIMVLSPRHHHSLLQKVYYAYEEKPGPQWHKEMRPLSYELNRAELVHWLDSRFNLMWLPQKFLYYPFLLQPESRIQRIWRKLSARPSPQTLHAESINAAFQRSYFFHLGGMHLDELRSIHT